MDDSLRKDVSAFLYAVARDDTGSVAAIQGRYSLPFGCEPGKSVLSSYTTGYIVPMEFYGRSKPDLWPARCIEERKCEWARLADLPRTALIRDLDISDVWVRLRREIPDVLLDEHAVVSLLASYEAAYYIPESESASGGLHSAFQMNRVIFRVLVQFRQSLADEHGLDRGLSIPIIYPSLLDEIGKTMQSHPNGTKLYVPAEVWKHITYGEVQWSLAYDAKGKPCAIVRGA